MFIERVDLYGVRYKIQVQSAWLSSRSRHVHTACPARPVSEGIRWLRVKRVVCDFMFVCGPHSDICDRVIDRWVGGGLVMAVPNTHNVSPIDDVWP